MFRDDDMLLRCRKIKQRKNRLYMDSDSVLFRCQREFMQQRSFPIANKILADGTGPVGVIVRPAKSTVFLQNLNFSSLILSSAK